MLCISLMTNGEGTMRDIYYGNDPPTVYTPSLPASESPKVPKFPPEVQHVGSVCLI